jgi:hypothetical protein
MDVGSRLGCLYTSSSEQREEGFEGVARNYLDHVKRSYG